MTFSLGRNQATHLGGTAQIPEGIGNLEASLNVGDIVRRLGDLKPMPIPNPNTEISIRHQATVP